MASITTLASYLIVISLVIAVISNRPSPVIKKNTIINNVPRQILVNKNLSHFSYSIAQVLRAIGLLIGLIFAVALLFAEPNTGLPWFDSVVAAFVAIWTSLTYSSAIESSYRRLIDWGGKVRTEALAELNQEEPSLSAWYVAGSELFVSSLVLVGGYILLSGFVSLPSFEQLTRDQTMALLLIVFVVSIIFSSYKTGKHALKTK